MKKTILAFGRFEPDLLRPCQTLYDVICLDHAGELGARFREAVSRAHGLIIGNRRLGAVELDRAKHLEIISCVSAGHDNHDLGYLTSRGIMLTNTPGVPTESTADLAFALILATARRIPELDAWTRGGSWTRPIDASHFGCDVHGKTLGIIGLGEIGAAIARRGRFGFGMRILYSGRRPQPLLEHQLDARFVAKDELLREADFVCPVVPLTAQTRNLIDREALALMKPAAILINISRGGVVDETALVQALEKGAIRAAGLDVFAREPLEDSQLFSLHNVVAVPHIGSATGETRAAMAARALENLLVGLEGRAPRDLVNPQVLRERCRGVEPVR